MEGPCRDCEVRVINCHSCCTDYKNYRIKIDAINEIKKKDREFMSYSLDRKLVMGVWRRI